MMRIEYFEPKLEIIDLLDVDIVTGSTSTGDNDIGFLGVVQNAIRNLTDNWESDGWDNNNTDSWN